MSTECFHYYFISCFPLTYELMSQLCNLETQNIQQWINSENPKNYSL
jgi:hypothetical protein